MVYNRRTTMILCLFNLIFFAHVSAAQKNQSRLSLIEKSKWISNNVEVLTTDSSTAKYSGAILYLYNDSIIIQPIDENTGKPLNTTMSFPIVLSDTGYIATFEKADTTLKQSGKYKLFLVKKNNVLALDDAFFVQMDGSNKIHLPDSLYDKFVEFEVGGFKIGDIIKRDSVEIVDIYNFFTPIRELGMLNRDHNIYMEIVGDSIVIALSRNEIPSSAIENIKEVISGKLGIRPSFSGPDTTNDRIVEEYSWGGDTESYYIYLSRDKTVFSKTLVTKWSNWELHIDSPLWEAVIKTIYFPNPESMKTAKSFYIK